MVTKKAPEPMKIVAIPISWMLYRLPANTFEIMGGVVQNPPLIVAESLVDSGMGQRIREITTGISFTDESEEKSEEEGPWYQGR